MIDLVDVQSEKPKFQIPIGEVGVKGIRYPIRIQRSGRSINLTASINIFADIPSSRKGADFSRNIEAINEVILAEKVTDGVESLALRLARKVLEKLPYSNRCAVEIEAEYLRETRDRGDRVAVIPSVLIGRATVLRDGNYSKGLWARIKGITACPCAMETTRAIISRENPGNDDLLKRIPSISHNQRNIITLGIDGLKEEEIEADDLITIGESSLGGPLYSLLKREDEGRMVYRAHSNPMFVEDIVRELAVKIGKFYGNLPVSTVIEVSSESEESIHPHNAYAKVSMTIGDILKIAGNGKNPA
ncbi:MAG: GTP cyclohydrolase MptA [Thermoplasmataceae archaeon]